MLLRKSTFASLVCAVAIIGATAGAAFAGEITGTGDTTPIKDPGVANSRCAFSGLNDGNPPGGRTQSYGQNVKAGRSDPQTFNPGSPEGACRGN